MAAGGRHARGLCGAGTGRFRAERCGRCGGRRPSGSGGRPHARGVGTADLVARVPRRRLLSRRGDRPSGTARAGAAAGRARRRCEAPRGDAGEGRARRLAERARDSGRDPSCLRGRARDERGSDGVEARGPEPHELRLLRRPDGAGAGAARGDRLDRRRGRLRLADVPPLLPHHERRTRADGQRYRADRLRRSHRRPLLARTGRPPHAPRPACGGCCRRSPTSGSSGRGAVRSTSRPTISRSSARSPGRGSTTEPVIRATASGRAGSAAASSPRSCSAWTTSGRGCRSRLAASRGCRGSRSNASAAESCAGRS